jgi:hypothetical protein
LNRTKIQFTTRVFKEGRMYVAQALELDVASCGTSREKTLKNLDQAVRLFLEEAERMSTHHQILNEAMPSRSRSSRMNFDGDPTKY